jgi:glycosyltransferase 2 family protein
LRLPIKPLLIVLCIAASLYALILFLWGDINLAVMLGRLNSWTGLGAIVLCVMSYLLRGLRWRIWMARHHHVMGLSQGLRLYLAGYAFTPTPGNIGEAARGLLLARNPLTAAQSLTIFAAERAADLVCLVTLALPCAWWLMSTGWLGAYRVELLMTSLLVAAGFGFALWFAKGILMSKVPWLKSVWLCLGAKPWQWLLLTSVAWALQGFVVWLLCAQENLVVQPILATGIYATAMVAGAASMLPAGLGGMESVLTALLVTQGAPLAQAVVLTVLVRLLTLWLAVAIGVVALVYSAVLTKDINFK